MAYKRILIAVDSSEQAENAVEKGMELVRQLSAEAALIYVVDLRRAIEDPDSGISSEEILELLQKEATETLDRLARPYSENLQKLMPSGAPEHEVLAAAENWGADMIIVGSHARTGLAHLIMGSTAEHLVRHSKLPVMIVPKK